MARDESVIATPASEADKSPAEGAEVAKAEDSASSAGTTPPATPDEPVDAAAASKPRRIKFMGTADFRTIPRGDDAGGTLPPLPVALNFQRKPGNWIVSSADYPDVPDVWWDHLAHDEPNFEEVTDAELVPLNAHQRTFLGMTQAGENRQAAPEPGGLPVSSA